MKTKRWKLSEKLRLKMETLKVGMSVDFQLNCFKDLLIVFVCVTLKEAITIIISDLTCLLSDPAWPKVTRSDQRPQLQICTFFTDKQIKIWLITAQVCRLTKPDRLADLSRDALLRTYLALPGNIWNIPLPLLTYLSTDQKKGNLSSFLF